MTIDAGALTSSDGPAPAGPLAAPEEGGGTASRVQELVSGPPTSTLAQFVRYVFVGGAAFVADFGTLALLKESGLLDVLGAATVAFMVGTGVNYAISTRWVFTTRTLQSRKAEFAVFTALGVMGLGLNLGLIWLFTGPLRLHYLVAKVGATGLTLCWNFFARKWALFRG